MKNGGLKDFMGFPNFPVDHDLYSDKKKGQLGMLNSETSDISILQAICLNPSAYSVLLDKEKAFCIL